MICIYVLTSLLLATIVGYVHHNYILPRLLPCERYKELNLRSQSFLFVCFLHCCIATGDWLAGINLVSPDLWKLAILEMVIFSLQMYRAIYRHSIHRHYDLGRGFKVALQLDKLNAKRIWVTFLLLVPILALGHTPVGSLSLFVHSYYYCKTELRMMECMTGRQGYFEDDSPSEGWYMLVITMAFVCLL